jgi:ketosteroid isomerase-like protein
MRTLTRVLLLGAALGSCSLAAQAEPAGPARVVDRFHEALHASDAATALQQLAPDLVVFETGYGDLAPGVYLQGALANDLAFAVVTRRNIVDRSLRQEGNTAWVMSVAEISGKPGEQAIRLRQTETMMLRRYEDGWKIAHIHWSAHSLETP